MLRYSETNTKGDFMDCPVCKDSPMITLELDEVEVDYCLECGGIWLDAGELEMLLEEASQSQGLLESFVKDNSIREALRKCPICDKKMDKVVVGSNDQPLIIDKCKKNHGLWFDRGELGEILSRGQLDKDHKIQKLLRDIFAQE